MRLRIEWGAWFLALIAVALLAAEAGIAPRPGATDYPAQAPAKGAVLAAALVPPDQIKRIFFADLDRSGYLVFEVAVYPEEGRQPVMEAADFVLAAPPNRETIHLAAPATIAAAALPYQRAATTAKALARAKTAPPPAGASTSTDQARTDLEFALNAKALPSGKITGSVAGYLYFRKPDGGGKTYQLIWFGPNAPTQLILKPQGAPAVPPKPSPPKAAPAAK